MKLLTEIGLFAGLSDAAKAEVECRSELRTYSKGEIVLRRGELGRYFYAITKGTVSVHPASDEHDVAILLGPGEIFGEMALLSNSPVSATVVAGRDSEIYAIANRTFDMLFANEPSFRGNHKPSCRAAAPQDVDKKQCSYMRAYWIAYLFELSS